MRNDMWNFTSKSLEYKLKNKFYKEYSLPPAGMLYGYSAGELIVSCFQ